MSAAYRPILWNRFKKQYDLILWGGIILYLLMFTGSNIFLFPHHNLNTILIRAFGTLAILLLHIILLIGPFCRLSPKFLPILYNRRHLGVSMFIIAFVHGILSLTWFHGNTDVNPLVSLFTANKHYGSIAYFPFQTLGFSALIIFAAMAFTSHDFWLSFLSPKFWKAMHMLVYIAYALVIMHVAMGIIQFEKSPVLVVLLLAGLLVISTAHLLAAFKENKVDNTVPEKLNEDWQYVCNVEEIEDGLAKMAVINKERIAVFKYDGKLSAVHNVCKHQMGPLGEGRVVDGCITCPWHGYQYRPEDGCAPAPFKEKLHTYPLQLMENKIHISTKAMPEGTYIEPTILPQSSVYKKGPNNFFIGWSGNSKKPVLSASKIVAFSLVGLLTITSFVLVSQQKRISTFQIDYTQVKQMEGWLENKPVPMFTIIDGKDGSGNPLFKSILLVDAFKNGAGETVSNILNGAEKKYVHLTGYLSNNYISCGDEADSSHDCASLCTQCITGTTQFPLMEIENGLYSFKAAAAPFELPAITASNKIDTVITGEIIDPKCYFGAMNPGQGKTHLSCAVRCISGGIMPVLKYQVNGTEHYAILIGTGGEAINKDVCRYIGMPVVVRGKKTMVNNWEVVYTDALCNIKSR
ncbi:MAG: Rieske 2Fe-2S domain-containing protein [Chitinophagaceae bacterium]